jgi:hypothetical protein
MKKILNYVLLHLLFICIALKVNAQCTTNSKYQDLIDWVQNSNSHLISVQFTIINSALQDGTHYYTAWGKENLIFTGPLQPGGPKLNRCRLTTVQAAPLLYSDREQTFISNLLQPFSINLPDKQKISIDLINNNIISESITWHFTTTYKNINRNGNIIYGFSGGSMIILNLHLIENTVL